ncbi:MAG TPA: IclR family transcriptional regulator [Ktedonobacteraceae bacterium]
MDPSTVPDTKVGVLDKAMRILYAFSGGDVSLTPQQIAKKTGIQLPTVYRLAQVLNEHGWLVKKGQQYRLGMTLLRLGAKVAEGIDVRSCALPHLRWLRDQTNENAELFIRFNESRIAIEVALSPHNLRVFVEIGTTVPLHVGAAGKVLLAWLSDIEQRELIKASVTRYTNHPVADLQELKAKVEYTRQAGWVASEGERADGLSAIAAPIFNVNSEVAAAMTLVVPTVRLGSKEREAHIPLVREAARRTSFDMGYSMNGTNDITRRLDNHDF